jgi:hypothetical protein
MNFELKHPLHEYDRAWVLKSSDGWWYLDAVSIHRETVMSWPSTDPHARDAAYTACTELRGLIKASRRIHGLPTALLDVPLAMYD